jgi:hypothetical protein
VNRNDARDCWAIFGIGCVVMFVLMCWIDGSIRQSDRKPENAWRIYQESKIDEAARLAKEGLK